GRARALHHDAGGVRAHLDVQVLALARGVQKRDRGRTAPSVADGILAAAEALAGGAVVILGHRQAGLARGLDPGGEHRVFGLAPLHADRAFAAAPLARAVLEAFQPPEVR